MRRAHGVIGGDRSGRLSVASALVGLDRHHSNLIASGMRYRDVENDEDAQQMMSSQPLHYIHFPSRIGQLDSIHLQVSRGVVSLY